MESKLLQLPSIDRAWTESQLARNLNRVLNPAVCYQAIEALKKVDSDFAAIAATLQGDPFVAAKVVGLANLMRRGGDPTVTSIERAVAVLGVRQVQTLVLAVMLTGPMVAADGAAPRRRDLWRWVFGCAAAGDCLGNALEPAASGRRGAVDRRFLVQGLLMGLGALILHAGLGRAYDQTLGATLRPLRLAHREQRDLGVTHHHVTVWALRSMRCPPQLSEPAESLMEPADDDAALRGRAIEMLAARAVGLESGHAEAWLVDALPRLGLAPEEFIEASVPGLRARVRELTKVFEVDLGDWQQRLETRQQTLLMAGAALGELLEQQAEHTAQPSAA